MKILAIYGGQVDSHGGTKFMVENIKALRYVGHQVDLAIGTDLKPNKTNFNVTGIVSEGKWTDSDYIDSLVRLSDSYDLVYIFCLPYHISKQEDRDIISENIDRFLDRIKTRLIISNVDHNTKCVLSNIGMESVCRRADLIMLHSEEGALAKKLKDWKIDTPLHHQYTSRDYSYLRDKYWRPVSDMNLRSATWIGRTARWKKPDVFAEFAYDKLNKNGFTSTIEGIEMSIIYYSLFKYQRPVDFVDLTRYKSGDHDNLEPGKCYLFNKYVYEEEMERLSHTGFGADLYTLKPNYYGTSLEQSHIDIVNVGSILMCSKHFGENCLTLSGNRYIDECPDIIYLDRDNFDECFDRIDRLSRDPDFFDRTRENIFEFIRSQSDISVVGPKLDEIIHRVVD